MHPVPAALILTLSAAAGFLTGLAVPSSRSAADSSEKKAKAVVANPAPASVKSAPAASGTVETWMQRLQAAAAGELPALAEEIAVLPDERVRRPAQRLLCARWAEAAPAEGLAYFSERVKTLPNGYQFRELRIWLLTEWALLDLEAVWAAVSHAPDLENEKSGVGEQLLREDQERFWQWFVRVRKPLPDSGGGGAEVWRELARAHFDEMQALAREHVQEPGEPPRRQRLDLYAPLAEVMAERDAAQALTWAKTLPEELQSLALIKILKVLAKSDPQAAGKWWAESKDFRAGGVAFQNVGGSEALETILTALHETAGPLEMLKFAGENSGGGTETEAIGSLLAKSMRSGALSFQDAFQAVLKTASDGERIRLNVLSSMWRGLPAEKLVEAAGWLSAQPGNDWNGTALTGVVRQWQTQDPAAALAFTADIPDEKLRREVWDGVIREELSMQKPEEALALLNAIPADERAASLAAGLTRLLSGGGGGSFNPSHLTGFDPALYEKMLRDTPPSPQRVEAVNRLGQAWGALDPAAASAWALQQPDLAARREALSGVADGWAQQDAYAFSEWTAQLPAGPERDTAAHRLARAIREQEPDSAWVWASQITDAAERQEARLAVLRKWRDSAPEAARAAIEAAGGDPTPLLETLEKRNTSSASPAK